MTAFDFRYNRQRILKIRGPFCCTAIGMLALIWLCIGCGIGKPNDRKAKVISAASATAPIESAAPLPQKTGFVGSRACQGCHASTFESYQHHSMSKSLEDALHASKIEDFDHASFSTQPGLTYYVERKTEGVFHHEKRVDASGELIYDQGIEVAFAVGSGTRGRSYLINESGRLYASPISWFNWDQKWDLSPGYAPESNARFDRRVSDGCVSCHAGRIETDGQDLNRFALEPFPERSIGCERCHGPGADHIKYRSALSAANTTDPIFNPARLNDARRDAVCNQCHLQGRRRVVLAGRTEFDFQAGMTLSDNWVIFLKTDGISDGEAAAVSQVEQMYASRCYQKSDGKLGCITCHSGHEPPTGNAIGSFYREKCVNCHSPGHVECSEPLNQRQSVSADDSCVACHMPRFPAADVHATQTDHRILQRPQKSASPMKKSARFRDAKVVLFEEPGIPIRRTEQDRARGIFLGQQAAGGGTPEQARKAIELLSQANRRFPSDVEGRFVLGQALEAAGQPNLAAQAWQQTLQLQPSHEEALESLATLNHRTGNLEAARDYYQRLIEVNPQRPNYYGRLAHVLGQLNELPRAIETAEKCLSLNPSLAQTHAWLVEACRNAGDEEKAAEHETKLKQFQSLKPGFDANSSAPNRK